MKFTLTATVLLLLVACQSPTAPTLGDFVMSVDGRTVTFTTTADLRPKDIVSWSFGDGNTGTGASIKHTYEKAGTYSVTQEISGNDGKSSPVSQSVTVEDPPVCNFIFTSPSALCIQFENRSNNWSFSASGHSSLWQFGDSTNSSDNTPLHCYVTAGSYQVRLEVQNNGGRDDCSALVTVPMPQLQGQSLR